MKKIDQNIDNLDLEPIKYKLVIENKWDIDKANDIEEQYKGYLHLCKHYPQVSIVPTEAIDEFWHAHILDTKKYMEDCDNIFGEYLHHFPYAGMRGPEDEQNLNDVFELSKALFEDLGISLTFSDGQATCQGNKCGNTHCQTGKCYSKKNEFSQNKQELTGAQELIEVKVAEKTFKVAAFSSERPRLTLNA